MKIHVIPAWLVRNTESIGYVYDEQKALELKDQGDLVTYEPQERICMKDRHNGPKITCYMCERGNLAYYMAAK